MIQKIATDVSNKLNVTRSSDFDGMVGMEAHLRKVNTLLCLESDEVKMIGIWGPAGIGKTTITRALFNQLSSSFRLRCFMGNIDVNDYDSKLRLQSRLLSEILKQKDMKIHHLGAVKEWLHDQKVLIILDDVDDLEQLKALAKETSWFGPGSRIIVTTKDKKILKALNDIYHVHFPSKEEAVEILCLSAFKQSSPRNGFGELTKKVVKFCGNLPLGLRVVGSSLYGESKDEWMLQLHGLETNLDRDIADVLRVGYDRLFSKHQSLFLYIACLFNNSKVDHVTTMLADSNLDVGNGSKTLGLRVVGASLYGEREDECRLQIHGIETNLDRKIEDVLRVGYDKLLEKDQSLFLHIACFFNHCEVDHVITVLADSNMDVQNGLKTLSVKTLVQISTAGCVEMHNLLQQFGRQVVVQQSWEPGKRQFLVEDKEIYTVK